MSSTGKNLVKFLLVIAIIFAALYFISGHLLKNDGKIHAAIEKVECSNSQTEVFYTLRNISETRVNYLRVVVTAINDSTDKVYEVKITDGILANERRKASIVLPRYDCDRTEFKIESFTF